METMNLFNLLVILTGWTVAMGVGAFISWVLYERNDDQ